MSVAARAWVAAVLNMGNSLAGGAERLMGREVRRDGGAARVERRRLRAGAGG